MIIVIYQDNSYNVEVRKSVRFGAILSSKSRKGLQYHIVLVTPEILLPGWMGCKKKKRRRRLNLLIPRWQWKNQENFARHSVSWGVTFFTFFSPFQHNSPQDNIVNFYGKIWQRSGTPSRFFGPFLYICSVGGPSPSKTTTTMNNYVAEKKIRIFNKLI